MVLKEILLITLLFYNALLFSQQSAGTNTSINSFDNGMEYLRSEKYGLAQEQFKKAYDYYATINSIQKSTAQFYIALCAAELYHNNAEYLLLKFINENPGSQHINQANLALADYYYANKNYALCIRQYQKVSPYYLDSEEKSSLYFKKGYAYLLEQDTMNARRTLYDIIDIPSYYHAPAVYYYSHINYSQGNYQTALNGFLKLTNDPTFGSVVPYYIIQIYYFQGKYSKIAETGPEMLQQVTTKREAEVLRIIGEAYFNLNKPEIAMEYLEQYTTKAGVLNDDDNYLLAYNYYKLKRYPEAAAYFARCAESDSELGQNASFHLADCYLKTNEKQKAGKALHRAASLNYNKHIAEEALFNYALISFETPFNPFKESVKIFELFIQKYPQSSYLPEAQKYLLSAYLNSNDYTGAFESLDKIGAKSEDVKKAMQQLAFNRGLELFINLEYQASIDMLNKSYLYHRYNSETAARTIYWIGEAYYRLNDYVSAIHYYNEFIQSLGSFNVNEYNLAHYNLGYAYFKRHEFDKANTWFRKYEKLTATENNELLSDAYNRIADCYFIQSSYWPALDYYKKASDIAISQPDYAMFKLGFTYGLVNRTNQKIETLEKLLKTYPGSVFADDATYELGRTFASENNNTQAEKNYLAVINNMPTSEFHGKAMVNLGLLYYNQNQLKDALVLYKRLIEAYPGTNEAKNALIGVKNIYIDKNDVDNYFAYVEKLDTPLAVQTSERDSLTFLPGENLYMKGDCDNTITSLQTYLNKFPQGANAVKAHFYLADCYFQQKLYEQALPSFIFVKNAPRNVFTEQAMLGTSRIYYFKKQYEQALPIYIQLEELASTEGNKLEARLGQFNCYYALDSYDKVISFKENKLPDNSLNLIIQYQVRFKYAKALYAKQQYIKAYNEFHFCADKIKTPEGSESKFRMAEIQYKLDKWPTAEQIVYDFIDQGTTHQYWLAKSFLLLADIYIDTSDEFQANHTLNSIIDNYENKDDGIIKEAWEKKRKIKAIKEVQEKAAEPQDVEVEFNDLNP